MLEFRELTVWSIVVRILTAVILGGIIGRERGMKNRPAGLRTYMLVSIGACVVMMINQYVYQISGTGDPMRLGAQVISGIGFLGAGTIIVTSHNHIKGLTTAAGLWATACIGLAVGIGLYEAAVMGGGSVYIVLTVLHNWDHRMRSKVGVVDLYVELVREASLGSFIRSVRFNNLEMSNFQREEDSSTDVICLFVTVEGQHPMKAEQILHTVQEFPSVGYAEIL